MSKTQELPLHVVNIHSARGKDVMVVMVPKHEIGVLRAVHRPDNVKDQGITDEVEDFPVAAADEIARLQRKYRRLNDADPVRFVFPNLAEDLDRHGFELTGGSGAAPQSSVTNRPRKAKAKPEPEPEKAKPEKAKAEK